MTDPVNSVSADRLDRLHSCNRCRKNRTGDRNRPAMRSIHGINYLKPFHLERISDDLGIAGGESEEKGPPPDLLRDLAHIDDFAAVIVNDLQGPFKSTRLFIDYDIDSGTCGKDSHHVDECS